MRSFNWIFENTFAYWKINDLKWQELMQFCVYNSIKYPDAGPNQALKIKHLHLLSLVTSGSAGAGFDKSSKLIMNNDISSTSERIGAITSEHRNFCPDREEKII